MKTQRACKEDSGRILEFSWVHPTEAYVVGKTWQKHERNLLLGLEKRGYGKPFFMCLQSPLIKRVTKNIRFSRMSHISSKQDMLYQILNHAMDELDRVVSSPVRLIEDPEERLRQLIRLHIQGSIQHGLAFTALMSEINHLAAKQQKQIRGRIEQYHALIRETLRELADSGRLRSLDIDIATMHIMKTITGIARWKYQDFASDAEHLIQETIAYTMAALLNPEKVNEY